MGGNCSFSLQYAKPEEIKKMQSETSPDKIKSYIDEFNKDLNLIKTYETNHVTSFIFWDSPICKAFPDDITLNMIKKQMNEKSKILGLAIPFPYIDSISYFYYILLIIIILAVGQFIFTKYYATNAKIEL
jgi:hypothetical protein